MATTTSSTSVFTPTTGRVKWFNNKAGYGFITLVDCETQEERDIFAHHSEIQVSQSQYKYLVQGEYVELTLGPIVREKSTDIHATKIRGVNGGKLMCETRNEVRANQPESRPRTQTRSFAPAPAPARAPASAPEASRRPQLDKADQSDWMVVPRRRAETAPSRNDKQPRQRQPEIELQ
jgi:cold shock CspA family protein